MKKENKGLNIALKITGVIFIITVILTLVIILNKGNLFGFRLVEVSGGIEETHTIQIVALNNYISVDEGETEIYVTIDGADVSEGYELLVSDEDVISVEGNTVKALDEGTATITAISNDYDIQSEVTINVIEPITKLTIESEYKKIDIGEQTQISYTFKPSTATIDITYVSTDEEVATINSEGIVTGVSEGTTTIIATDNISGKTASYNIEVMD